MAFNRYLDTILAAHQPPPGSNRQNQSPWLFLEAANTIFESAKRRVYIGKMTEDDASGALPDALRPILEEQPKWAVLADVLEEIERDNYFNPIVRDDSNGTILIMCSDQGTCRQLREYLQNMYANSPSGEDEDNNQETHFESKPSAMFMMRRKLRDYLNWKKDFAKVSASLLKRTRRFSRASLINVEPMQIKTRVHRTKDDELGVVHQQPVEDARRMAVYKWWKTRLLK